MLKRSTLHIGIFILIGSIYLISKANTEEKNFKNLLLDYIKKYEKKDDTPLSIEKSINKYNNKNKKFNTDKIFSYDYGDWNKFIISPQYSIYGDVERINETLGYNNEINMISYGSMMLNMNYGGSVFTEKKYMQFSEDKPASRVIKSGFLPEQELLVYMEGNIGKRLKIFIDHDSRRLENHYLMQYRAIGDDEIIREINAGEIDINFNHSKYAVYDNNSNKGMGMDVTLKKNNFQIKAFGSVAKGKTRYEYFKGNSSPSNFKLSEYQYTKLTYYQLEPFHRYDGISTTVDLPSSSADFYNLTTFTSAPPDIENYTLFPVNIDYNNFELYMDDQNQYNNNNSIQLPVDGGYYTKLQAGVDYSINFAEGLITFIKKIPQKARIFASYTKNRGTTATSDPSARTDVFPGKIFVFIKYDRSIHEDLNYNYPSTAYEAAEDRNGDSRCNLDIYEIRSFYFIGSRNILSDNFVIQFQKDNSVITKNEITDIGRYSIDYSNGFIKFLLREPFKKLLASDSYDKIIYSENQSENIFQFSKYKIQLDYFREARSFKLKHFNIIPNSIKIRIDGKKIPDSLYTVDYTSGFLIFNDPNNPMIVPETDIEVKYEFLPFGGQSQNFIGGLRADYSITKNMNLGASFLYEGAGQKESIPTIGETPSQTFLIEADGKISLDEKSFTDLVNKVSKEKKRVPVELNIYGEYARSYKHTNTFEKALIDNMESTESTNYISLSENNWLLSSMPENASQNNRGFLYYKYYRDPSDPDELQGLSFNAYDIDYDKKPGPYNVATGHIDVSIQSKASQLSMGLDFNFSGNNYVSIRTKSPGANSIDLSGIQYVEFWYRSTGGTGNVELYFDVGSIDEDSDGDSILDSEDENHNSILDYDPDSNLNEDTGFSFSPTGLSSLWTKVGSGAGLNRITSGNGILDNEDINNNGTLDNYTSLITFPGTATNPSNSSPVIIDLSDTTWQKVRIYLDKESTDYKNNPSKYDDLLKRVETIRLYLKKNGSTEMGTVLISDLKFITSNWKKIDKDITTSNLTVTMIDSINDDDYKNDSFKTKKSKIYKSLYGEVGEKELSREKESALKLQYSIDGSYVAVSRFFSKPLDIRFYGTMSLWFNYRSYSAGDEIGLVLGSSDSDYMEYRFPMDSTNLWEEIKLKLSKSSKGSLDVTSISGSPDLKRIKYIKIVIYSASPGSTGVIWVNDIYVSDPEILEDDAHWFETELKITKPIFTTKNGMPLFSNLNLKYLKKGHGSQFNSVGKNSNELEEDYHQLFTSVEIVPNWTTMLNFTHEQSDTEDLNEDVIETSRGDTKKSSMVFISDYVPQKNAVPRIKLSYKYEKYYNEREEIISTSSINKETEKYVHSPSIFISEEINKFLGGKLTTSLLLNMIFKDESIERISDGISSLDLSLITSKKEMEKRQKTEAKFQINYLNKYFFIKPEIDAASEEIVSLSGKKELNDTEIYSDLNGQFHLPFIYDDDLKFVERIKRYGISLGLNSFSYLAPQYSLNIHYHENNFKDYSSSEIIDNKFSRSKDSNSFISTTITLPIYFNKIKKAKALKTFNISYNRSIYFFETSLPYEGEHKDEYNESFGIRRSIPGLANEAINIFQFYPFYFFLGRENYANCRDYIYNTMNKSISFSNGTIVQDYNNQLKLIENFSLNWSMDFSKLTFELGNNISQICERVNIRGVPQQVLSISANVNFNFNLMKFFNSGFFRPNKPGLPHHASNFELMYKYSNNMIITSNIEEHNHAPGFAITFKWDRAKFNLKFNVNFIQRNDKIYISYDDDERSTKDDVYIENMPERSDFKERDAGYSLALLYETDVKWMYKLFSKIYKLYAAPLYSIEYNMQLNRYDYTISLSPWPYDLHLFTSKLVLDIHKNIQGELSTRIAVEQFRHRDTLNVNREIFSYELGFNFKLLF